MDDHLGTAGTGTGGAVPGDPLKLVNLDHLAYQWWEAEGNYHASPAHTEAFARYEDHLVAGTMEENPQWAHTFRRVKATFDSMMEYGLWNPLLVKQVSDTLFVVLAGNQRLCSLRAMDTMGILADRLIKVALNPTWGYRAICDVVQYREVPGGYSRQYGYLGEVGN